VAAWTAPEAGPSAGNTGARTTAGPPAGAATASSDSAGELFDDFDYASSADPHLATHGWTVRTGAGAPGKAGATWSAGAVTFPRDAGNPGGHLLRLSARTDGTGAGTVQSEVGTARRKFRDGTYAARVYFTDAPDAGRNGDYAYETFFAISPLKYCDDPTYGEEDYEYLPNGDVGGSGGPRLYTTTYHTYCPGKSTRDGLSHSTRQSRAGWHTLVETVAHGTVTYYLDGLKYWATSGNYYPRADMTIDFSLWFDGFAAGAAPRTWTERAAWVYFRRGAALSTAQVRQRVGVLAAHGTNFTDTVPG